MPSYPVTFSTSSGGLQSARFTLDDDVPLAAQVPQVIEELQQQGYIIQGGPDDELAVFWNGAELDTSRSLRSLGVLAVRPIELRMRPRPVLSHQVLADAYFPKASYAATLLGLTAGAVTWSIGLLLTDLTNGIPSYAALDLVLATIFGALAGGFILGFEAFRRFRPLATQVVVGAFAGGAAAGIGALLALLIHSTAGENPSFARSLGDRVIAWTLVSLFTGTSLSLARHRRRWGWVAAAALISVVAGALAAIVYNFPGPTGLWQGIAFCLMGGAVGYAVTGVQLGGAQAIVEVDAVERHTVGLLGTRGLALLPNAPTDLGALSGRTSRMGPPEAVVQFDGRRVAVQSRASREGGARVRVGGEPVDGAVLLGDGETIEIGTTRYRLHLIADGSPS